MVYVRVVYETPHLRLGRTMEHGHSKTNGAGSDGPVSDRWPQTFNEPHIEGHETAVNIFRPGVFPLSFGIHSVNMGIRG